MGQECHAGGGQGHATVLASEQRQPQLGFKGAHQLAQCRLRDPQLLGCPAEVLQVGRHDEGLQVPQFHSSYS